MWAEIIASISPYVGWPQFVTDGTKEKILKLSSTLHATAGDPDEGQLAQSAGSVSVTGTTIVEDFLTKVPGAQMSLTT